MTMLGHLLHNDQPFFLYSEEDCLTSMATDQHGDCLTSMTWSNSCLFKRRLTTVLEKRADMRPSKHFTIYNSWILCRSVKIEAANGAAACVRTCVCMHSCLGWGSKRIFAYHHDVTLLILWILKSHKKTLDYHLLAHPKAEWDPPRDCMLHQCQFFFLNAASSLYCMIFSLSFFLASVSLLHFRCLVLLLSVRLKEMLGK